MDTMLYAIMMLGITIKYNVLIYHYKAIVSFGDTFMLCITLQGLMSVLICHSKKYGIHITLKMNLRIVRKFVLFYKFDYQFFTFRIFKGTIP